MKLKKVLLSVCSVLCLSVVGTALSGCATADNGSSGNGSVGDVVDGGSSLPGDSATDDVVAAEGVKYWIPEGENYAIAYGYAGEEKNIVIASEYDGMPVTAMDPYTYYMNHEVEMNELRDKVGRGEFFGFWDNILSVVIPDSVTSIGSYAFWYCSSLTNVVIGNRVTFIWDSAFRNCSSLTSVVIPDSVVGIALQAFEGCSSLESVVIPDSVTTITDRAFAGCGNLTIYCEVESKPSMWIPSWNPDNRPVEWGYKE